MANHSVEHLATLESPGTAHDEHNPHAVIGEVTLHHRKCDTVIGSAYDDRIVPQTIPVERFEHGTHLRIQGTGGVDKQRHVLTKLGRVRKRSGRTDISRIGG